jgi:hypothetical protein
LEFLGSERFGQTKGGDTGIIDHDINMSGTAEGVLDSVLYGSIISHVQIQHMKSLTLAPRQRFQSFAMVRIPAEGIAHRGENDISTASESFRRSAPETCSRTSYRNDVIHDDCSRPPEASNNGMRPASRRVEWIICRSREPRQHSAIHSRHVGPKSRIGRRLCSVR